jgi:hypothetical protein
MKLGWRHRQRWENNFKMVVEEILYECVDYIDAPHNSDSCGLLAQ